MKDSDKIIAKKFNISNLPYFIMIFLFIIFFLFLFFTDIFLTYDYFIELLVPLILLFAFIICPISLFSQIKNNEKTKFDKIILFLNSIGIVCSYLILILLFLSFPTVFAGEKQVRAQVSKEYEILNKEYTPVLEYLAKYKKIHGKYPNKIDENILPNSKTFMSYEYHIHPDGKSYWLRVYPKKIPIEYYHNDEGYDLYQGNGYIDGFLDNDNYYEIDNKWHAIKVDYFSRHSILNKKK